MTRIASRDNEAWMLTRYSMGEPAMKDLARILAVLAVTVATIGLVTDASVHAQSPIVMKLATGAEQHLSAGKGYGKFADLVNERAAGKVKVEVYYAGALGNEVT